MLGKPGNKPNPRNANHLLVGYIPVRAVRRARGRRALREDADLERLDAVADAGRAGAGPFDKVICDTVGILLCADCFIVKPCCKCFPFVVGTLDRKSVV